MKQILIDINKIFQQYERNIIFYKVQLMFECGFIIKRIITAKKWSIDKAGAYCSNHVEELGYKQYGYQWWYAAYRTTLLTEDTKITLQTIGATITNVKWLVMMNDEDREEHCDAINKHQDKYKFPVSNPSRKKKQLLERESKEGDPDIENIVLPYPFDEDDCINKLCNYFSRVSGKQNGIRVIQEVERKLK